jgi:hypothetical protein
MAKDVTPVNPWILSGGTWNDEGDWYDSEFWEDS